MSLDGENLIRTEDYPTYDTRFSLEPALYFAFRDVRYPVPTEDGIFPEHVVAFYEIIVADRRPYCCRLDGKPLTVPPRDILVIKPWQKHSDIFQQDNGFYAVHFQIYSRQGKAVPFFAAGVTVEQQVIRHDENGHVQNLLEFLLRENKYTGNKDFLIQKYLFQAFFWALTDLCAPALLTGEIAGGHSNEILIRKLNSIFENHLYCDLDLATLCEQTRMSGSTLRRKSLELFGLPPLQAFMRYKMLWIRKYLQMAGDLTVGEAAARFGFKTPYHFSRVFKKITGIAPSECAQKRHFE